MEPEEEKKEIEDVVEKKEEIFNKKGKLTEKMRENPWILSTFVLGVVTLIFLIGNFSGGITGNVVSKDVAGEKILEFANQQGADAELVGVEEVGNFYEVTLIMDGRDVPLIVTKDGEYFLSGNLVSLSNDDVPSQQDQQQTSVEYSEEDLEKLSEFSSCLAQNGLKIYGANWCGWTKKLAVETLGGFDVAGDAYIECTEEKELCDSEGVEGYPTVKLDGEVYSGDRTLEGLGEVTDCAVPELEGTGAVASSSDASCN